MGGFLGLGKTSSNSQSSDNSTSTGTQNSSTSSTPQPASYQLPAIQDYYSTVGQLANTNLNTPGYASSLVPGATNDQTAAYNGATNLNNNNGYFATAGGIAGSVNTAPVPQVQAQSLLTNLNDYMNPYTNAVVDTTLQGLDQQSGKDASALENQGASSNAFGNSRFGLATTNLTAQQEQNRAATEANLRDTAFNTGANLSNEDTDRRQSAATTNANLQAQQVQNQLAAAGLLNNIGTNVGDSNRADIASQLAAGDDQRSVQADQALAPFALTQYIQQLLGVPGSALIGNSGNSTTDASSTSSDNKTGSSKGTSISAGISG